MKKRGAKPAGKKAKPIAKAKPVAKKKGLRPQASGFSQKQKAEKPTVKKPAAKKAKPPAKNAKPPAKNAKKKPAAKRRSASGRNPKSEARSPSSSASGGSRKPEAGSRAQRGSALSVSPVVEILDDPHPTSALRRFLDGIDGEASEQQAQIALGAAQLVLLPIAREHRGGDEVKELVDLLLERWLDFGARRTGFHAQEFLRNAFAAIGADRERIARLEALVPSQAGAELRFNIASAHASARDKPAMLRAITDAIDVGSSPSQFRREPDFAPYATDSDFLSLLARAEAPPIPVDIDPHVGPMRRAIESLVATLRELGMRVELRPPVRLDAILDAERARKMSLPNDFRALLTITNGMDVWEQKFFAISDFREPTKLALRAQQYLDVSAQYGAVGIEDCIPIASWGQPNDWLLYDRRGRTRGGEPGYVLMQNADELPISGLVAALARIEYISREVLGTN